MKSKFKINQKSNYMYEKQIRNTKINRITFLIFGILFMLLGFFAFPFLLIGVLLLLFSYMTNKKYKELLNEYDYKLESVKPETKEESPYIFLNFKVAGVTFKNGRKTRQAILRAFKWGDEDIITIDFEPYEFEGKPAVYVKINDQIVGNIPANTTETFLEYEREYVRDNVHCEVYGGSKLDDGTRTNYGCEIYIRYKK